MTYGIRLDAWGEYACFTWPEMKVERVSHDIMTPLAVIGTLKATHRKPAIRGVIDASMCCSLSGSRRCAATNRAGKYLLEVSEMP